MYQPRGFCSLHRGQDLRVLHQNGQYLRLHHVEKRGEMFENLGSGSARLPQEFVATVVQRESRVDCGLSGISSLCT